MSEKKLEDQQKIIALQDEIIEKLEGKIGIRNRAIDMSYNVCLCKRFETKGFDYGEKHPRVEVMAGSRLNTPRDIIESIIGYEWSTGGQHPKILNTKHFEKELAPLRAKLKELRNE